jgi:hypothetical protein
MDLFGRVDAKAYLEAGRGGVLGKVIAEQVGGEKARGK